MCCWDDRDMDHGGKNCQCWTCIIMTIIITFIIVSAFTFNPNNKYVCDKILHPNYKYSICFNNSINVANYAKYNVEYFDYKITNDVMPIYPGDPDNLLNQYVVTEFIGNISLTNSVIYQEIWIINNYLNYEVIKGADFVNDKVVGMFWSFNNSSYYLNFETMAIELKRPWFN